MSRFYASIQGCRGEATRQGSAKSGIEGHIRGWDVGVKVFCDVSEEGEDVCTVYLTSGSNGHVERCLGYFTKEDIYVLQKYE